MTETLSHPAAVLVLLVGAAHPDRVARAAPPFVPAASNPGRTTDSVGGAAFNAGVALRRLALRVTLVSARGGPPAGATVAAGLAEHGIEDAAITWLDRRTPSYTAVLDDRGELVAAVADMALYDLVSRRVLSRRHIRDLIAEAAALLVDANLPADAIAWLVREAAARPVAAIGVSPAKVGRLAGVLPDLSALFLTRAEAQVLTEAGEDEDDVVGLARALAREGVRRAVVTDGPRPCAVLDGDAVYHQEPPPVEALDDVTGAGDTLAGTAFGAFLAGRDFLDAARLGIAAASLRVSAATADVDFNLACETILSRMAAARPPGIRTSP